MNSISLLVLLLLPSASPSARALEKSPEKSSAVKSETITSDQGEFKVLFDTNTREVSVRHEGEGSAPPYLKLRIKRKNQAPLEVQLHALERPETQPPGLGHYVGKADTWNGSVMGFELDFSFDKQVWKKIKRALR